MKFPPSSSRRAGRFPLTAVLLACAAGPLAAQTIPNPGFEADTFTVFPGYVSGNPQGITGWTGSPAASYGLNPSPSSPFADNGTVPEGTNVAFIQSSGGVTTELSTTISGLTAGTQYRLSFRANARGGQDPILSVSVGGTELMNSHIWNVGGTAPYRNIDLLFTADSATTPLVLQNQQADPNLDTTVVVDDFTVTPQATSAWSFEQWSDASTSGLDPQYNYTHLYNFNSSATPGINGLFFKGILGANPAVTGSFSLTGLPYTYANDTNSINDEDEHQLANDFIYGGDPGTLTLEGLKPNTKYLLTFYSVGWEGPNGRWIDFRSASGTDVLSIDQDSFGNDSGIRVLYSYTSDAAGKVAVTTRGLSSGTFHTYGFSNREVVPAGNIAPVIAAQPAGALVIAGDTVTISSGASGVPVPNYQWYLNGSPVSDGTVYSGATTKSLIINGTGGAGAGLYTLKATNVMGSATSNAAFVEVYSPKAGPLFSTGVDDTGAALSPTDGNGDPSADTHYTMTVNPDGDANIPAVVETGIPSPPWVANSTYSTWIGATPNTSTPAGGVGLFTYSTTVDVGNSPDTFNACLFYAVDNLTNGLLVNGQPLVGTPLSQGFDRYTITNINKLTAPSLHAGVNTVDIVVENLAPAGPTGLRVSSVEVPAGLKPVIIEQPVGGPVLNGQSATLSTRAYGSGVVSYQWTKNGANIAGATGRTFTIGSFSGSDNGTYAVKATNALGAVTSSNAILDVRYPVGGVFSTGVDDNGTVLADGASDDHYVLLNNPAGDNNIQAVVETSTVWPIVAGPWLAESNTSKWIGPLPDSNNPPAAGTLVDAGAGSGIYAYRTTFDLTGFEPASAIVSGQWTSDNDGIAIRVNGKPTGIVGAGNFAAYESFTFDDLKADFVSGVNTLDFLVLNAGDLPGPTGLRVNGLSVVAAAGPVLNLPPVTITVSATGKPVISFPGTPGVTYPIQRSTTLTPSNSWSVIGQPIAPANGQVQFEDPNPPAGRAFYRAVIPQ